MFALRRPSDCPPCYKLVQEHITILRVKINELRVIIENIGENPQAINDTDFRMKMAAVNASVVALWQDARDAIGMYKQDVSVFVHSSTVF